jgi:hypothetical protein
MGEVVNLNRFRKAKAKKQVEEQAKANRAAFGRTKAEKASERKETDKAQAELDGKKLDE